jgi:hypothetical protein
MKKKKKKKGKKQTCQKKTTTMACWAHNQAAETDIDTGEEDERKKNRKENWKTKSTTTLKFPTKCRQQVREDAPENPAPDVARLW